MKLFIDFPNLIGVLAGEVQYCDFSEQELIRIGKQCVEEGYALELISEIDRLKPQLAEVWEELSLDTNIKYYSYSDTLKWLLKFKGIIEKQLEQN